MSSERDRFWLAWVRICDRRFASGFDSLSRTEKEFYCINYLKGCVMGDGFHSYFNLAGREEVDTAKRVLRECCAPDIARIVERAEKILFPQGVPHDMNEQRATLPGWTDEEIESKTDPAWSIALDAVDAEFYSMAERVDDIVGSWFQVHLDSETKRSLD